MKVSVIIPSYNHAPYLKQRINSVLTQSYQGFELILLDDNSNDGSQNVLFNYSNHPKVSHLILNQNNSGSTFKQWNRGVDIAKGDWIWIAESDDLAEPNFLKELLRIVDDSPKVGIAYANSFIVDETDNILSVYSKEFSSWSSRWQENYINEGKNEVINFLRFSPVILNVSSCIFRREVFLTAGGCDESFKLTGDWLAYIKMLNFCDIAYVAKPLNYFRKHAQTVRNRSKQFIQFYEMIQTVSYIYQNFEVPQKDKRAQGYHLLNQLLQLGSEIARPERAAILNYMQKNYSPAVYYWWFKLRFSGALKKIRN